MLATVLGCVCLGIASLIYLAVSWQHIIVQSSRLNIVNFDKVASWGRKCPLDGNKENGNKEEFVSLQVTLLRSGPIVMKGDVQGSG